jgi:site-specific DNA-methyltransferase (adenine-specific)
MSYDIIQGDCLDVMRGMADNSVDAIITDLPYGTTTIKWDTVIPLDAMWTCVKRVLKLGGVFVTTASQPFTTNLIASNMEWFKYEWIWHKTLASGFLHAKNAPLKAHENIIVFSGGAVAHAGKSDLRMNYNPQMVSGKPYKSSHKSNGWAGIGKHNNWLTVNDGTRYPSSVLYFKNPNHKSDHPTQKPVELYEYLIRTYTNAGDTVLDICMGSGTTGVAAINTGRRFIGIERESEYVDVAQRRIEAATVQLKMEEINDK